MPRPEAAFRKVLVDLALTTPNREIVPHGIEVASVWFRRVPGGLTQFDVKFGDNEAFSFVEGDAFSLPCSVISKGVYITTAPALPGTTAEIMFGIADPFVAG